MSDACPPIDVLSKLVHGQLGPSESTVLRAHVDQCANCSRIESDLRTEAPASATPDDAVPQDDFVEVTPERVGPYRIIRTFGHGGMGTVYEAQQDNPRRSVAIKIIRPNVMSRAFLERLRYEAQILGRLSHPGIARIYEVGTFNSGNSVQPYLVMELVSGLTLIESANAKRLSMAQRLDLLAKICDAVEHAHQRGVIHRDLKPDNIHVDDTGETLQPKILDFGVGRITDPTAQVTTLHTSAGQIVGTVAYMSPEQAGGQPDEIDTRTDVYALGVIGYQLLSGQLPYDVNPTRLAESIRTIIEQDPKPLAIANPVLRGDLTTIIGKALAKERSARYPSAAELAADIRRYLADEPILAHPPSAAYLLRKFAKRNRGLVVGATAALMLLVLGSIGTTIGMVRANRARRAADQSAITARNESEKQKAVSTFLESLISSANPRLLTAEDRTKGKDVLLSDVLNAAAQKINAGAFSDQPEVECVLHKVIGKAFSDIASYQQAERHLLAWQRLSESLHHDSSTEKAEILASLALLRLNQGRPADGLSYAEKALEFARASGDSPELLVHCLTDVGLCLRAVDRLKDSEAALREALDRRRAINSPELATSLNNLALVLSDSGKPAEAETLLLESLEIRRRTLGEVHPDTASTLNNLGFTYSAMNRFGDAERSLREALAIRRKLFGDENRLVCLTMTNLGATLKAQDRYDDALLVLKDAMDLSLRINGTSHPDSANAINNYAATLGLAGKVAEAEPLLREALRIRQVALGGDHALVASSLSNLGEALIRLNRAAEAEPMIRQAIDITTRRRGPEHRDTVTCQLRLGNCLTQLQRFDEAESILLECMKQLEAKLTNGDPQAQQCARHLSTLYKTWGKSEVAREWAARLPSTRPTTSAAP